MRRKNTTAKSGLFSTCKQCRVRKLAAAKAARRQQSHLKVNHQPLNNNQHLKCVFCKTDVVVSSPDTDPFSSSPQFTPLACCSQCHALRDGDFSLEEFFLLRADESTSD
mmetsp:Transcript_26596/g.37852  ORF Transcript_26596/g.37852 Transcript_26596/m.37852 type:complete len:109 (-) Transcript_26596:272-598(-)